MTPGRAQRIPNIGDRDFLPVAEAVAAALPRLSARLVRLAGELQANGFFQLMRVEGDPMPGGAKGVVLVPKVSQPALDLLAALRAVEADLDRIEHALNIHSESSSVGVDDRIGARPGESAETPAAGAEGAP